MVSDSLVVAVDDGCANMGGKTAGWSASGCVIGSNPALMRCSLYESSYLDHSLVGCFTK